MIQKVLFVSVIVRDQEEALRWYTENLGMEKRDDDSGTMPGFRWLTVGFPGEETPKIVLFKADDSDDLSRIGQGTMWVLATNDCRADYERMKARGVKFEGEPKNLPWGVSAVFEDLYGNGFNLIQPSR